MLPKELFKKIKHIEITTNRLVNDVFAGQYQSVFRGRGMEFDEVREYQFGDDIRSIDWNVTARTGKPHIKKYVEERELTVMFLVDGSMSCCFASVTELKSKLAAQIAAILAFSAIRNNDKVGLIFFTDRIEKFIPPRKGKTNVLRLIREVLYFQSQHRGTDISAALEFFNKVSTRKTVAFVLSDFYEKNWPSDKPEVEPTFKKAMTIANKRHDLIAVTLNDPIEQELPNAGLISLEDAETGALLTVDSAMGCVREDYRQKAQSRVLNRNRFFDSLGIDHIDIDTQRPYAKDLAKFFLKRRKRH